MTQQSDTVSGLDSAVGLAAETDKITAAGQRFVARYYSRNPRKNLTSAEAGALIAAGIGIVSVWEAGAYGALGGAAQGKLDAERALAQAQMCRQPPGSAIYFAVDFDATDREIVGPITGYFSGISGTALAPLYRVGVYGSGCAIFILKKAGLVGCGWLAGAMGWLGSFGFDDWDIKQGPPADPDHFGFEIDPDQARGDFGGWSRMARPGAAAAPGAREAQAATGTPAEPALPTPAAPDAPADGNQTSGGGEKWTG